MANFVAISTQPSQQALPVRVLTGVFGPTRETRTFSSCVSSAFRQNLQLKRPNKASPAGYNAVNTGCCALKVVSYQPYGETIG